MSHIAFLIPPGLRQQLFTEAAIQALAKLAPVRWASGEAAPTQAEAIELCQGCDIAVSSWGTPHPGLPGLLTACPQLRLWEHVAGSVQKFFNEPLTAERLIVASCKRAIGDSVAEYVLGQLIVGLRRMPENAAANRLGLAGKPPGLKVLAGSRIGIVGASVVGRELIRLLKVMRAEVHLFDPYVSAAEAQALGVVLHPDLLTMMSGLDALSLHTPLTEATRRQLRREHFQALPDDCLLINAARGECLDQGDLIRELSAGRLHAYLDVSNPEPAAADSPLRHLPNVTLTSHIAGPPTTLLGDQALADIAAFLRGESPRDVITVDMLPRIA